MDSTGSGRGASIAAICVLVLALVASLIAQPAFAETRVALVVGNGGYAGQAHLPNPVNDAEDISAVLDGLGFKVVTGLDLDKDAFDSKLHEFARIASGADVALFFYSGHGMQINGVNYLVPINAPVTREDLDFQTVTLDFVQKILERAKTKIVMLDACRNNPFAAQLGQSMGTRAIQESGGLAVTTAPDLGHFVAFATQPGHVASDGTGRNSPFTAALKAHIGTPGLSISDLMIVVRNEVVQATNSSQIPWDHSALSERFYFKEGPATEVSDAGKNTSDAAEVWSWVRDTSNPAALQQFIAHYGDSPFAAQAKARLVELEKTQARGAAASVPIAATAPLAASRPAFDCRLQTSEAEAAICNKPELALLDNEMSRLYMQALKSLNEAKRIALMTEQRLWVKARNGCGSNAACLLQTYQEHIAKLKGAVPAAAAPAPQLVPSFDCNTRQLPAEVAVCNSAELAQFDRDMDRLYVQRLKAAGLTDRVGLVASQRHWVRNRNGCGPNLACLKVQYQARIAHLER